MADLMFPIFDAHQHYSQAYFDQILDSFTECGVKGGINLWGNYAPFGLDYRDYEGMLKAVADRNLDTFVQFYWPNWKAFGWEPERFVKCLCRDMRRFAPMGCRGLTVWKDVGMFIIHPREPKGPQLIFVVLILWHLYDVHLAGGNFPMNPSWLTGKMKASVYHRQHRSEADGDAP